MSQTDQELDRIERSIDIDATAERVWQLLVRPGWWINEGTVDPDPEVRREGDVDVVTHPRFGEFRLQTVASDPPRFVSYRWIDPDSEGGTLVEFWVEERGPGAVTLRVRESGFLSLGKPREEVVRYVEGNTEGWETELAAARQWVLDIPPDGGRMID